MREFSPAKCASPAELEHVEKSGFASMWRMVLLCLTPRPQLLGAIKHQLQDEQRLGPAPPHLLPRDG